MTTKLRLVLTIPVLLFSFSSLGQQSADFWREDAGSGQRLTAAGESLRAEGTAAYLLEEDAIRRALGPLHSGAEASVELRFPDGSGGSQAYRVREQSVMAPELQARYPEIRSYVGTALADPASRIRFSMSPEGFQAMLRSSDTKSRFIEKVPGSDSRYMLFASEDKEALPTAWKCATEELGGKIPAGTAMAAKLADDQILRTYRLAVAASGEYTEYHGGSVSGALSAMNATVTRINEVFERDLAIRLVLVANTDQVIFTDPSTDPFGGNLSAEIQTTLDTRIGSANYDIGHLFHQGGETGNAGSIGAVCRDGFKGSAYAATPTPEGDRFDLDFVAHEMGHQFGANHTWSFDTEGTGVQAEPASGTTIMGYAGIVQGNNVALTGDDYFHYFSIVQIGQYAGSTTCGSQTALSNGPPVVSPLPDYLIPQGTAFALDGVASDPDPSDVLTYTWEQIDDGVVTTATFGPDNPAGANFRSLPPVVDSRRFFPSLSRVVSGNLTQINPPTGSAWETVSEVERDLNFALTVRDNAIGGGQTAVDLVKVRVLSQAGPFRVLSQQNTQTYTAGSIQAVSWDVAGTRDGPINCQLVDILFSPDGGQTFPVVLASGVPNSGNAQVQMPAEATPLARLMVRAADNVFFAVNDANFSVSEVPFVLESSELTVQACPPADAVFNLTYKRFSGFAETVDLDIASLPPGVTASFAPAQVQADNTPVVLTLSGSGGATPGTYPLVIQGTGSTANFNLPVTLQLADSNLPDPVLLLPGDGAVGVPLRPQLEWTPDANTASYVVQLATDAGFTNLLAEQTVFEARYLPAALQAGTDYFWRVKPQNACGEGVFGTAFTFTTSITDCKTLIAQGLPATISATGTPTITSTITFADNNIVVGARVLLDIDHSYLSDLVVTLRSPAGTEITLFANACAEANDVNATFEQGAPPFICGNNPAISGVVSPLGSLDSFAGESSFGQWVLTIQDTAPSDGGQLNDFQLELCVEGLFRPDADGDGVFDDTDDLCLGTPPGVPVDATGCPVYRFAPDQFDIVLNTETCIGQGDGQVVLTASEALDYTLSLSGNGVDVTSGFTSSYTSPGLAAGTYQLCIGATEGSITYEQQCFEVQIGSPDPLSVVAAPSPDGALLQLELDGAEVYRVSLNGQPQEVASGSLFLSLKNGLNTVRVEALPACKGVYEETFFYSDRPLAAPNPFNTHLDLFVPRPDRGMRLQVFNASGRLVLNRDYPPGPQELRVPMPPLPSGLYLVRVSQEGISKTIKLFHR